MPKQDGKKANANKKPDPLKLYTGSGYRLPWSGVDFEAWKRDLIPGDQVLITKLDGNQLTAVPCSVESYPYYLGGSVDDWFVVLQDFTGASAIYKLTEVIDRISPPKADMRKILSSIEAGIYARSTDQLTREVTPRVMSDKERRERDEKMLTELTASFPDEFRHAVSYIVKSACADVEDLTGIVAAISSLASYCQKIGVRYGITTQQLRSYQTLATQIAKLQTSEIRDPQKPLTVA